MKRRMMKVRQSGQPKYLLVLKKSRHVQRWLLRNPWNKPMSIFNLAAIRIQQAFRGQFQRKHNGIFPNAAIKNEKKKKKTQLDKYLAFVDYYKNREHAIPWLHSGFSVWCALRIQSWFRMLRIRRIHQCKKTLRLLINQIAAIVIQSRWKIKLKQLKILRHSALQIQVPVMGLAPPRHRPSLANRIIRKWRSFCSKRVYAYLKDVVTVKLKGAPSDLLRTIIPKEIDLMDKASGVHVRFRLGGAVFPPKIYFKVFTHRPLCDVNAFAPRPYHKEHPMEAFQVHNHMAKAPPQVKCRSNIRVGSSFFGTILTTNDTSTQLGQGWYNRSDNNAWRPIACQVIDEVFTPPWMNGSRVIDAKPFHFSRLRRVQDIAKWRKQRQIDWRMKAYRLAAKLNREEELDSAEGFRKVDYHQSINDSEEENMSQENRIDNEEIKFYNESSLQDSHRHGNGNSSSPYGSSPKSKSVRHAKLLANCSTGNPDAYAGLPPHTFQQALANEDAHGKFDTKSNIYDKRKKMYAQHDDVVLENKVLPKVHMSASGKYLHLPPILNNQQNMRNAFDSTQARSAKDWDVVSMNDSIANGTPPSKAQSPFVPMLAPVPGKNNLKLPLTNSEIMTASLAKQRNDVGEEDLLVDWCMALDFDDYAKNWLNLGTSLPSTCHFDVMHPPNKSSVISTSVSALDPLDTLNTTM